jgi:hypothetical protein
MALSRSSIFSSESLPRAMVRIPRAAALAVALVLATELVLHLLEDHLPRPVLWGAGEGSAKIAQVMARARNDRRELDVLILGPSHARFGISPRVMMTEAPDFGWSVYNGAVNGRTYSMIEFALEHVYGPLLEPRMLVLTASPIIFTRSNLRMERNSDEFFDAPMPRALRARGLERVWRQFLVERVYLYRYRKRQHDLDRGFVGDRRVIDDWGFGGANGVYDEARRFELLAGPHPYKEVIQNFAFGGPSLEAFARVVERAKRQRVPVVVVDMPFRGDLLRLSSHGGQDYQTYLREMARLKARYDFAWLDYQASLSLGESDFRDVDHLNLDGAHKLSLRLAEDLKPLLRDLDTRRLDRATLARVSPASGLALTIQMRSSPAGLAWPTGSSADVGDVVTWISWIGRPDRAASIR